MTERRFYLPELQAGVVALGPDIAHHIGVLRLQPGAKIVLFDGKGTRAEAMLIDPTHAKIDRTETMSTARRPITIAVPLLKGDRQDWLVEKLCELGTHSLQPFTCERSVINELSDNKRSRMERLVVAACKQSGRAALMQIAPLTTLKALAANSPVLLSPHAACALRDVVSANTHYVIGPEGGLTEAEEALFPERARLDSPILRAETAAMAVAAIAVAATHV